MAIKGTIAKSEVMQAILKCFGDKAFIYEKDVRVNWVEDGQPVQIKISLTAAKVAVERDGDTALPAAAAAPRSDGGAFGEEDKSVPPITEPTADEKANVAALLARLGL